MASKASPVHGGVSILHTVQDGKHHYEVENILQYKKGSAFARKGDKLLMINEGNMQDLTPEAFAELLTKGLPMLPSMDPTQEKCQEPGGIHPFKKEETILCFTVEMSQEENPEGEGEEGLEEDLEVDGEVKHENGGEDCDPDELEDMRSTSGISVPSMDPPGEDCQELGEIQPFSKKKTILHFRLERSQENPEGEGEEGLEADGEEEHEQGGEDCELEDLLQAIMMIMSVFMMSQDEKPEGEGEEGLEEDGWHLVDRRTAEKNIVLLTFKKKYICLNKRGQPYNGEDKERLTIYHYKSMDNTQSKPVTLRFISSGKFLKCTRNEDKVTLITEGCDRLDSISQRDEDTLLPFLFYKQSDPRSQYCRFESAKWRGWFIHTTQSSVVMDKHADSDYSRMSVEK